MVALGGLKEDKVLSLRMKLKFFVSFISLLAAQVFFVVFARAEIQPPAPTILQPSVVMLTTAKPLIAGVSQNDTIVEITVDEIVLGKTATNNHPSGTGNFFFQIESPLATGAHAVSARAIDESNQELKSSESDTVTITIIPFGAPTLFLDDEVTLTSAFTYIKGVAHNGSRIHIYIDNEDVETFDVGEHASGSVGFNHALKTPLQNGKHTVYLKAEDGSGRFSPSTPLKTIKIVDFPAPTILAPSMGDKTWNDTPIVFGIAFNDSTVKISVDGLNDGVAKVKNSPYGVGVFTYTIRNALERGQPHTVTTKAYDLKGRVSRESNPVAITVSQLYIPPTLFAVDGKTSTPLVTGVAHNDSTISIFVDGKRDSSITPQNHSSGTLYFEARVQNPLATGVRKITAQAFDAMKKPSQMSNAIIFTYTAPAEEKIPEAEEQTPSAEEELGKTAETQAEADTSSEEEKSADVTEGQVTTKDEDQAKITGEETQTKEANAYEEKNDEIERATNWPLVGGILLLILLGIIFISWYLGGKRRLLNDGIDRLFSEDDGSTPPAPSDSNPSLFSQDIDLPSEMKDETSSSPRRTVQSPEDGPSFRTSVPPSDDMRDIPPPPPPAI